MNPLGKTKQISLELRMRKKTKVEQSLNHFSDRTK